MVIGVGHVSYAMALQTVEADGWMSVHYRKEYRFIFRTLKLANVNHEKIS
jgi:hypothetical protein